MRVRKKMLANAIIVMALSLFISACGVQVPSDGNNGGSSASAGKANENAKAGGDKQYTIAFVPKLVGFPYFTSMSEGAQKAADEFGAKFIYTGPTVGDVSEQAKSVSSLIDQGVDAIGIAANSPSAFNSLITKAKEKGIMFYTSDSNVDSPDNQLFVQQATDKDLGYMMADNIAADIGEEGKIALLSATSTATNLNAWIKYIEERINDKYPQITMLETQFAGDDINTSTQMAAKIMAANPDLKGFIGVSAIQTPGIAEAVKQAGKSGEIAITGIALPNGVRSYIKDGTINKAVLWDPVQLGYLTVWGVLQVLEGKPFAEENDVPGIGKVLYDANTKTLLLGPPLNFDATNIENYDF
jgi:rhamnose transport system substrate-binding protein